MDRQVVMRVELTLEAQRQLDRLPVVVRVRIGNVLRRLAQWPNVSGVRALSGPLAGWFRMRTGDYRIRLAVVGGVVVVDRIAHRKDVYKE